MNSMLGMGVTPFMVIPVGTVSNCALPVRLETEPTGS